MDTLERFRPHVGNLNKGMTMKLSITSIKESIKALKSQSNENSKNIDMAIEKIRELSIVLEVLAKDTPAKEAQRSKISKEREEIMNSESWVRGNSDSW